MMLRVSTQVSGEDVDLKGIVDGDKIATGVPFDKELIQFAEAALGEDEAAITEARQSVAEKLGEAAMVDAAGVIANFQRMVRIADGTGIPLDKPMAMMTSEIREDLGLNTYGAAGNTPPLSMLQKLLARLLKPILPFVLRRMTKGMTGESAAR